MLDAGHAAEAAGDLNEAIGQAVLREYRRLADGHGPLAATAFVTGTVLLEQLGITDWPG
ncbi:hypothetical protein [Amycolatopsis aidingensis]|uniref:hypothetical protein n=1 Tax=Amycolatopsis aidingensis TaxID=2842453 RepID=UPI001C0E8299|nr:hypothetical protein [Amycolatopsis aidingensis]